MSGSGHRFKDDGKQKRVPAESTSGSSVEAHAPGVVPSSALGLDPLQRCERSSGGFVLEVLTPLCISFG